MIVAGTTRQRALKAEQDARLVEDGETPPRPNVEILSLDGTLGMQVQQGPDGAVVASTPDEMNLTYEIQIGQDGRPRRVGRQGEGGEGQKAWESDPEGGFANDAEDRGRRGSRHGKWKNGHMSQGNDCSFRYSGWVSSIFLFFFYTGSPTYKQTQPEANSMAHDDLYLCSNGQNENAPIKSVII